MFRCELCGKTAPPQTPAHKIAVETRRATYPLRPKVFACWKWQGDRRKFVHPDDPGGVGRQISREVTACPDCARKTEEKSEGHEPDAEGRRGAPLYALTNYGDGRAPPPRPFRLEGVGYETL